MASKSLRHGSAPDRRRAVEGEERIVPHSVKFYRLLVQSVKDYAIFMLDPQGNVVSWNEGAERIKGYKAEEIIGRSFTIFYPDDKVASGVPQHVLDVAARDGRVEDEGWRIRKDGSRFWANVVITALHQDDGRLIGFAKVTRDLTERRQAEEQQRLRLVVEHAARAAVAKKNAELQELNERLEHAVAELRQRAERQNILAQALARLLATDDPDKIARELFAIVATHLDVDTFFNYMVVNGERRLRLHSYAGIPEEMVRRIKELPFGEPGAD